MGLVLKPSSSLWVSWGDLRSSPLDPGLSALSLLHRSGVTRVLTSGHKQLLWISLSIVYKGPGLAAP